MANNNQSASGKVQFIESHQPALEDGDYTITVEQHIQIQAKSVDQTFVLKQEQKFSVLGPRFTLDPQEIQAVFPPPGSLGEHSNVLPHIIFKRSTLPWERSANANKTVPWLGLFLFDEGDVMDTDKNKNAIVLDQIKNPNSWMLSEINKSNSSSTVSLPKSPNPQFSPTNFTVIFPQIKKEAGDRDNDTMTVIDVPKRLLSQILPSVDELNLLAHVRQTTDAAGNAQGDEVAVIICNRLPKQGGMSIVHLVSLENRYGDSGFDLQGVKDDDLIRLVSLYSWRFACVSEKQTFKNYLLQLNHPTLFNISATDNSAELGNKNIPARMVDAFQQCGHPLGTAPKVTDSGQWKITSGNTYHIIGEKLAVYDFAGRFLFTLDNSSKPSSPVNQKNDEPKIRTSFLNNGYVLDKNISITAVSDHWWIEADESDQQYVVSKEGETLYVHHLDLDSSSTLRLPRLMTWDEKRKEYQVNASAEIYLAMGCVPLPHEMRQGNQSVSWFHGPLIPGARTNDVSLPIRSADELVRYSSTIGMFDVSYSAAWELGRLLTLQNKRASLDLFNWKRSHTTSLKDAEGQLDHLPFDTPAVPDIPESVRSWFQDLALLKGLPFNYLVPDERMLPTESIRFFQVDSSWVECMLDGAFSVGRVLPSDHGRDDGLRKTDLSEHLTRERKLSGFLLRSDVVSGWPGLLVDGYRIIDNARMQSMSDELNKPDNQNVSEALQKVFDQEGLTVPLGSTVTVIEKDTHWSINDSNLKPVYKVAREEDQLLIKLPGLRMDRLSKNVLLCLFEGIIQAIDIHLKPETLHFGVNERDDEHPVNWYKTQRDKDGIEQPSQWKEVSLKDKNVIDIATLVQKITVDHTSAELALQMIEGVENVRFVQKAG